MPPRSLVPSSRRPLSAIFLGSLPPKGPKEANIPDLPEPSEISCAASPSGLPSPPATNSTGSGSTGDNNSANSGSVRQRPVSYSGSSSAMIHTETYDRLMALPKTPRSNSDDEDDENDHAGEEDNTARLDRRIGVRSQSENVAALQRVKSLAQRNRMALDKLSSRLNTPSPTHTSRSPNPPSSASTSSTSRLSSHSHSQSTSQVQRNDTLSGSETERESLRAPTPSRSDTNSNSYRSSSPERPSTPPSVTSSRQRQRLKSAPASPAKTRQASPGPSRTPRKRVSMAGAISIHGMENGRYSRNDHDVTEAALAAVASSRRSPKRSRQPLPREFRDRERRSLDGRGSIEPMTPQHSSFRDDGYDDDYPSRTAAHTAVNATGSTQYSPRGARSTRFSTVRDLTRRHQTRWLSDDLSGNAPDSGRRQSQRGGSAESALNGAGATGRLAGESLRAAGIGMRGSGRQGAPSSEDIFGDGRDVNLPARGARSNVVGPSGCRPVGWEDGERQRRSGVDDRSRTSESSVRVGAANTPPVPRAHLHSDPPRAPTALVVERGTRGIGHGVSSRPATSMADFFHAENDSRNGSYSMRRRTTYDLSDRPESRESPATRTISLTQTPSDPRSGTYSRSRASATPGPMVNLNNPQNAEHTRLMMESLSMFKSQLTRLPNQSKTVRDLSDHASAIIRSSERLNKILRAATTNAVQQQIAVEVDDEYYEADGPNHPGQIWRDVGSDFRESLRESDDVVRSLTGFILGVGKLLKETTVTSDPAHLRSMSLDDESRRPPSDSGLERNSSRRSQDGRRSAESRLSWEPLTSTSGAGRLASRSDLNLACPPSSRDRDNASDQDRSTSSRGLNPPSASRRLFAPREHRENQMSTDGSAIYNTPSDVHDLSVDHEPSPTPVSRYPQAERARPPLYSTPPPLPTLPSESLLQRSNTVDKGSRRNVSLASITTVRTPNPPFALPTPNPTTAISTHTASASPEISIFPVERTDSRDSARSSVTFSRPSGVSVSTLQQQQSRDEARRRVGTTAEEDTSGLNQIRSPPSGSETERDTRRRTLGVRAARMSLGAAVDEHETAASSHQPKTITFPSQRRERRRTVTEIFG